MAWPDFENKIPKIEGFRKKRGQILTLGELQIILEKRLEENPNLLLCQEMVQQVKQEVEEFGKDYPA